MFGQGRDFFERSDETGCDAGARPDMDFRARWARWTREGGDGMPWQDDGWMAMGGRPRGGPGPGPGGGRGGPFGFGHGGFPFRRFPWDMFGRGTRARRGDIRAAIVALLAEQPRNGYQIMQELAQRSQGLWRPSPGSVYPALQQLEDEGLVHAEVSGNGRIFQLTNQGRAYVKDHPDEVAAPWEAIGAGAGEQMIELSHQVAHVASAVAQVAHSGSGAQVAEAKKILNETRRALYRLLAEAGDAESEE